VRLVVPARLRKVIFWVHLTTASLAGIFILIMSVTGALLAYQQEITDWGNRVYRSAPRFPSATKLPLETLLSKVRAAKPGPAPSQVIIPNDANVPLVIALGQRQSEAGSVFVDPYTGAVLANQGSTAVDRVMRRLLDLHRYLGASDRESRAGVVGRAITGVSTIGFLFVVVSGFFLWWPRTWHLSSLRHAIFFRRGLRAQARDLNWHQVIGIWALVPLLIISASGVTMSYTWATNLVFHLTGSPIVVLGARQARNRSASEGAARRQNGSALNVPANSMSFDALLAQVERQVPQWRFITLQIPSPSDASMTFGIDPSESRSPDQKITLALNRSSGNVVSWRSASEGNLGAGVRIWLRSAHTGQAYGVTTQTIALLVCIGAAFEVVTGLSMLWRQTRQWVVHRSSPQQHATDEKSLNANVGVHA
jgi:uncharacterized iron-regulated membrane protein